MSPNVDPTSRVLGNEVVRLFSLASERWSEGDVEGAERIARGAWRLVGSGQLVETEEPRRDREARP